MIKFAHLKLTEKEFKRLHLKIMLHDDIIKALKKIQEQNMKKWHCSYCWNAVWDDMQNRCIVMTKEEKVLVFKNIFDEIVNIYKKDKDCDRMSFCHIETFDVLTAMFARDQISEC